MSYAWSEEELKKVRRAVTGASSFEDALFRAQKATPERKLTVMSLQYALHRKTGRWLSSFVKHAKHDAKKPEQRLKEDLVEHELREKLAGSEEARKHLLDELARANRSLQEMRDIRATRPLKAVVAPKRVGAKQRFGCPVMLCSDWHVEERVDPLAVNGLNEYSMEIADRRISRLAEAFEWLVRDSRFDCRSAVVWLGGDLFSGYIHEELVEKNFLSPVKAVNWLLPRLERMLRTILASCPRIDRLVVPCNDGNHGRITNKIRAASRTDNSLEWLMYHQLAARMKDEPRAQFQIADGEYLFLDVFGKTHGFFHGDSVKYAGGVGGVTIPLRRGLNELRKYRPEVQSWNLGHFHSYLSIDDINVNGSMIGITPYSMRNKFTPERPRQAWYLLDSERGKCLSAPIWLDDKA